MYCTIHPNELSDNCTKCAHYSDMYDKAYAEGALACEQGVLYTQNPYNYQGHHSKMSGWKSGWYARYCELNPRPPAQYYTQYEGDK